MYCSQCGTKLASPGLICDLCTPQAAGPGSSAESRLLRANLLRMRGKWDLAADQCADVLRLDPGNSSAHSLLGDIYQDQGRMDEARHWYQLALELSPSSDAARAKLARTEEMLEARQQRAEWEAVIEGRSQPIATSLLVRESLQRVGALAGAALCGIVLVMAGLMTATQRTSANGDLDQPTSLFRYQKKQPPIVMDTGRERELLKRTNEAAGEGEGKAVRLELNARNDSATLRVFIPRKLRESLTTPRFRLELMREGYRLARALHQVDPSLKLV
ncbi:MAG: hypothetical protein K0Q72_1440, partial [Armatimonadetes bacterium]|nr:hypothetical protein [Armatimonadota bacterium]